jgi:hypothetical protein
VLAWASVGTGTDAMSVSSGSTKLTVCAFSAIGSWSTGAVMGIRAEEAIRPLM